MYLKEYVKFPSGLIVMIDRIMQRVGRISPVKTSCNLVKHLYFFFAYCSYNKVCKYFSTCTYNLAKVFVPVIIGLCFLQMLRFRYKLFSEPFLRYCKICAVMNEFVFSFVKHFFVCPASLTFRRVKWVKNNKPVSSTHKGLIYVSNLRHTRKFVRFLVPYVLAVSCLKLCWLDFLRLIRTFKNNSLTCRYVFKF